jgi:hypothetical protein
MISGHFRKTISFRSDQKFGQRRQGARAFAVDRSTIVDARKRLGRKTFALNREEPRAPRGLAMMLIDFSQTVARTSPSGRFPIENAARHQVIDITQRRVR